MLTVFERVPDRFVELYDDQLQVWARNFRRFGRVRAIMLRRPVKPLSATPALAAGAPDPMQIVGVRLEAELDGGCIVIRPQTDADAEAIARHVVDMRSALH